MSLNCNILIIKLSSRYGSDLHCADGKPTPAALGSLPKSSSWFTAETKYEAGACTLLIVTSMASQHVVRDTKSFYSVPESVQKCYGEKNIKALVREIDQKSQVAY